MKINKMRMLANEKGFTLIELMIVIAIIGILAAVAIPNFIAYRDKSYCSAAESDANSIASNLADYFAIPTHVSLGGNISLPAGFSGGSSSVTNNIKFSALTKQNNATISGGISNAVIQVRDGSKRCPTDYQAAVSGWSGGVFKKEMK